jgi:predicted flap endonuclease-1-like 5' DNA nuclease
MPSHSSEALPAPPSRIAAEKPRRALAPRGAKARRGRRRRQDFSGAMSLHVSKLRGITYELRSKLKRQGIAYTDDLLRAAGGARQRRRLASASAIEGEILALLIGRADLARVKGIGAIFADMLELLGIDHLATLAEQDPSFLHARLCELNAGGRLARRAPTADEVQDWIRQARALPQLVELGA